MSAIEAWVNPAVLIYDDCKRLCVPNVIQSCNLLILLPALAAFVAAFVVSAPMLTHRRPKFDWRLLVEDPPGVP